MQFVATVSFTGECKYLDYCSDSLFRNNVLFYSTYPRMQVRYEDVISFFFTMLFFPHNCLENGIQGY